MSNETVPAEANVPSQEGLADEDPADAYDAVDQEGLRGGDSLTDLADVLRGAGLTVTEMDGWTGRQRGGAGYNRRPVGIIVHHTASGSSWDGQQDAEYLAKKSAVAPMANLYLDRSGRWWVLAAGATNTNGKGGPWGNIGADSANSKVIGIEAGNNGVGEAWPDAMQTSYVAGVAALAEHYGIETGNVLAHHEWAPTRKVDPAGPSRFGTVNGSGSWDMDAFRREVSQKRGWTGAPPVRNQPRPAAAPYVVQAGDTWWSIAAKLLGDPAKTWPILADANGGKARVLHPGDVLTVAGTAPPGTAPGTAPGIPPFPGEAKRGDHGPLVVAWQEALIAHGVIADTPGNHDGDYGGGLEAAVKKLQVSWGWSDADGKAGPHTWRKLHGAA
jgi:LysM repeat protein